MNMKYEMEVQADSDGELFLEFPDELLDAMNWSAGDTLIWEQSDIGVWTFKKEETNEG